MRIFLLGVALVLLAGCWSPTEVRCASDTMNVVWEGTADTIHVISQSCTRVKR